LNEKSGGWNAGTLSRGTSYEAEGVLSMNKDQARRQQNGHRIGKGIGITSLVAIVGLGCFCLGGCDDVAAAQKVVRPDIVSIDSVGLFGDLERPPVLFQHDKHTLALQQDNQDCTVCHLLDEQQRVVPCFGRTATAHLDGGMDRDDLMELYHDRCIECHKDRASEDRSTGPIVCGGCHQKEPHVVSSRAPIGFDQSLHHRHAAACEDRCAECHHVYDEALKKLIDAPRFEESSCRDCHGATTIGSAAAFSEVAHLGCLDCHRKRIATGDPSGPVDCGGCHDGSRQQGYERLAEVPHLDMNQPKKPSLLAAAVNDRALSRMQTVPFDHGAHERYTATCRDCHHKSLAACNTCHTMKGSADGGGVTLEAAMHRASASQSCLGCHGAAKESKRCAGCHDVMVLSNPLSDVACAKCHYDPQPGTSLESRGNNGGGKAATAYSEADIPEIVNIDVLSAKYEPARFPHRQVIDALRKGAAANKMAAHFHGTDDVLCQGCHHNNPVGIKPPLCGSCHSSKPHGANDPGMPNLMVAYHRQCIGCHEKMELENLLGCTDCHAAKTAPESAQQ